MMMILWVQCLQVFFNWCFAEGAFRYQQEFRIDQANIQLYIELYIQELVSCIQSDLGG